MLHLGCVYGRVKQYNSPHRHGDIIPKRIIKRASFINDLPVYISHTSNFNPHRPPDSSMMDDSKVLRVETTSIWSFAFCLDEPVLNLSSRHNDLVKLLRFMHFSVPFLCNTLSRVLPIHKYHTLKLSINIWSSLASSTTTPVRPGV